MPALARAPAIPDYELYGESPPEPGALPDRLHCESIQERSRLHDWRFAVHRHHRLNQFFWVESGGGEAVVETERTRFGPATVMVIPALCAHGFVFDRDTRGWVVTADAEAGPLPFAAPLVRGPMRDAAARRGLARVFAEVAREHAARAAGRDDALDALLSLLVVWVRRAVAEADAAGPAADSGEARLVRAFLVRVEERFRRHEPVAAHAAALAVTPTHLSRVCRAVTGRPASALIQQRLSLEARRMLAYTSMSVAECAYALGFADPAYFSRAFQRWTGSSPSAFRDAL